MHLLQHHDDHQRLLRYDPQSGACEELRREDLQPRSRDGSRDQKRCVTCGATYPKEATACSLDDTPLSADTVGRRWRVDGILSRRPGGGVFSAFHLVSGARAAVDLVPWPLSEKEEFGGRLYRELQALRMLPRHPHVPRLLETGTDRDGSRFVVTDLGDGRPLRDLLPGFCRPEGGSAPTTRERRRSVSALPRLPRCPGRTGLTHDSSADRRHQSGTRWATM